MKIGGLFEGYGGLTMGVQLALGGGELAWYSEYEPPTEKNPNPKQAPARLLAYRHPGVPNLGDITAVDWSRVEPVDVLCGGSPCQDVSTAGRRAGMRSGTRSGLWESMREAIAVLKPRLVVWENVRGVTSACAHSELADCPRCVGGTGPHEPVLRALGRVLGDMADLGFDAEWHGLRASDVGAPHERLRVFVVAQPANSGRASVNDGPRRTEACGGWERLTGGGAGLLSVADSASVGLRGRTEAAAPGWPNGGRSWAELERSSRDLAADTERGVRARHGLPVADDRAGSARPGEELPGRCGGLTAYSDGHTVWQQPVSQPRRGSATLAGQPVQWGQYELAIRRWERTLGRVAPAPTEPNTKGGQRLSPAFVEWMMGLPLGHVTDPAVGLTRNEQLKALGNGVVPQQAAAAIRICLAHAEAVAA